MKKKEIVAKVISSLPQSASATEVVQYLKDEFNIDTNETYIYTIKSSLKPIPAEAVKLAKFFVGYDQNKLISIIKFAAETNEKEKNRKKELEWTHQALFNKLKGASTEEKIKTLANIDKVNLELRSLVVF